VRVGNQVHVADGSERRLEPGGVAGEVNERHEQHSVVAGSLDRRIEIRRDIF
jgi:hypothetical protein